MPRNPPTPQPGPAEHVTPVWLRIQGRRHLVLRKLHSLGPSNYRINATRDIHFPFDPPYGHAPQYPLLFPVVTSTT